MDLILEGIKSLLASGHVDPEVFSITLLSLQISGVLP
jgi:hypothetical protein